MAMNVVVKRSELQDYLTQQVSAGHFPSADDAVEDAIARAMIERVTLTPEEWARIERSQAQIDRGACVNFDDFMARMSKKHGLS